MKADDLKRLVLACRDYQAAKEKMSLAYRAYREAQRTGSVHDIARTERAVNRTFEAEREAQVHYQCETSRYNRRYGQWGG